LTENAGVHQKGSFNLTNLISIAKKNRKFDEAGAIAVFVGVVRGETFEGKKVVNLKMEAYEEKANEVLLAISKELSKKPGIVDVQVHHLLGEFAVGEDVVYVSVAGSHREEVFTVLREAVERFKKEAPVFKKERVVDEEGTESEYWVSEKESHRH
jgi:molybdopterin synthase catalytic subunit